MPSFRAYLTSWAVWGLYYRRKRSSEHQLLIDVRDQWKSEYKQEVVPRFIAAATGTISVTEEQFKGDGKGGQEWKVFHCAVPAEAGAAGDKVVVYWHGGAFINAVSLNLLIASRGV